MILSQPITRVIDPRNLPMPRSPRALVGHASTLLRCNLLGKLRKIANLSPNLCLPDRINQKEPWGKRGGCDGRCVGRSSRSVEFPRGGQGMLAPGPGGGTSRSKDCFNGNGDWMA